MEQGAVWPSWLHLCSSVLLHVFHPSPWWILVQACPFYDDGKKIQNIDQSSRPGLRTDISFLLPSIDQGKLRIQLFKNREMCPNPSGRALQSYKEKGVDTVSEVAQSCLTLWEPMDCSLSGSSVHGIFQVRILECVAISFSAESFQPRDRTQVSHIIGRYFTVWATRFE